MKKKIYIIIILVLLLLCALFAVKNHKLYANEQNLLQMYTNEIIPEIVCIGDSLTAGTGGKGVSYPNYLESILWEEKLYIPVRNLGVGGENTVTIAARMSALPFRMEAFMIPKDTTPVEVHFISEKDKVVQPLRQGEAGINPCVIAGVEGKLSIEQEDYRAEDYKYYFTRSEAGAEVHVSKGSEVETYAGKAYRDGIFVVFIGQNRGFSDMEELIEQQQAILGLQEKNKDKYLILGLTSGTEEERAELEVMMQSVYGDKYINLREYLCQEGVYKAKVKLSEKDKEQMQLGKVPDVLLSDGIHFNQEGYKLIAQKVYEQMQELGYFEEVHDAVEKYGH